MSTLAENGGALTHEYKVADMGLADFGRLEISIAEHESRFPATSCAYNQTVFTPKSIPVKTEGYRYNRSIS